MAEQENKGVKELITEIRAGVTQKSSSVKDEVRVMQTMLNDKDYKVGVYGKEGKEGEMCPSAEARSMIGSVIQSSTKMKKEEAEKLADEHVFSKGEATNMVNVSKEYVNTYLQTKRKLPLGGRERSNGCLYMDELKDTVKSYPHKIGVDDSGNAIWQDPRPTKTIPGYDAIKASSSCPSWISGAESEEK